MESLGLNLFSDLYRGKRVLLTGHTGFKGSWLALWLKMLGAEVTGLSLEPDSAPNHWDLLQLDMQNYFLDIRDKSAIDEAIKSIQPEIVFHLAAQSLVRRSYNDPVLTWETNVMGTANLLEACREAPALKAIVIITSDKCYKNHEGLRGYCEIDSLGGHDPYSASKAGAELVAASFRRSFYSERNTPLLATARAGNVIGGGDWSEDRLIPDLVRAIEKKETLEIRSPLAIRPWQHVLESLSGYLMLGKKLLEGQNEYASAWNFGPEQNANLTVSQVLTGLSEIWTDISWGVTKTSQPHEAGLLFLDSSKANNILEWKPILDFKQTLKMTADWYKEYQKTGNAISSQQLLQYSEQLISVTK
jgi:CDP-glucose 4,6-dehydratase